MKATESTFAGDAGRVATTRDLARDLFPGPATPFAWTLLRGPADAALRGAYAELGTPVATAEAFWQLQDGYVYLYAAAVTAADEKLCGAAWLGAGPAAGPTGLLGRMQAGGVIRRVEARLRAAPGETAGLRTRLARWLAWVHGLRWTQADILQVMEELEPHAVAALQGYFLARAALNAADGQLRVRLGEWGLPSALGSDLYLAAEALPSVEAALGVIDAAHRSPSDPARLAALARYGHRGPGEMRPDASRWADAPALLASRAEREGLSARIAAAQAARSEAETAIRAKLNGGQARQFGEELARAREAMQAADAAWDALVMVMAAAQRWLAAAGREALLAGLVARPEDVLFLELEELKQVATGEWHGGRSADAQAKVAERMAARATLREMRCDAGRVEVVSGARQGPVYEASPVEVLPPPGAIWRAESLDPGCLPFWGDAGGLEATGCDVWSPGLISARGAGVPAAAGAKPVNTAPIHQGE